MPFISVRSTAAIALVLMGLFIIFHLLVIMRVVPPTIVWGGKIDQPDQIFVAELVSITMLLLSALVIFLNARSLTAGERGPLLTIAIWAVVLLFTLNTVGNVFAKTLLERLAFTPVTLLLALLSLRLALDPI